MIASLPSTDLAVPRQGRVPAGDFAESPFVVFYEVTQACDLVCVHCRACAQPRRDPDELTPGQSASLLRAFARFPKPPMIVLTGGDPMKRADVFDLVELGASLGLRMAMTPSATGLVTPEALARLRESGLERLAVSLDGVDATTHDRFRGRSGSFARTMEIMRDANRVGLSLQVNTTVTRHNVADLETMPTLLAAHDIALWSVFFLVPVGRGSADDRIAPEQYEATFEQLWREAGRQPFAIKTTEAPHYRRFVLIQRALDKAGRAASDRPSAAPPRMLGTNDGNGVLFVSHVGAIYPSGFMPIECGRFPRDSIVEVYQQSPTFLALRDASRLRGKCGECEFRNVCGGSRARAFALTGDPLASEPDCLYEPGSIGTLKAQVLDGQL